LKHIFFFLVLLIFFYIFFKKLTKHYWSKQLWSLCLLGGTPLRNHWPIIFNHFVSHFLLSHILLKLSFYLFHFLLTHCIVLWFFVDVFLCCLSCLSFGNLLEFTSSSAFCFCGCCLPTLIKSLSMVSSQDLEFSYFANFFFFGTNSKDLLMDFILTLESWMMVNYPLLLMLPWLNILFTHNSGKNVLFIFALNFKLSQTELSLNRNCRDLSCHINTCYFFKIDLDPF